MATVVRKTDPAIATWAAAHNALKAQTSTTTGKAHLDVSEVTVTAANGDGTLATALILVNQIKAVYNFHCADSLALKAVDSSPVTTAGATDLASAITLANAVKAAYGTHIGSATIHYNADATNTITAANASDQGTLDTLLNDIKAKLNAHMGTGMAPTGVAPSLRVISA